MPTPGSRAPGSVATVWLLGLLIQAAAGSTAAQEARPRIRDLGVEPGVLRPGPLNAITDVAGVRVGHVTLVEGDSVRTGVTAILPHGGDLFREKVPAAVYAANAFGKAAGFLQVEELGVIETPVVLTNTLSVGTAVAAVVAWTLAREGNETVGSVNALVGETNDGFLNDIRGQHVTAGHVVRAIETARTGPVAEGSVGAGTGTSALGWKGGIGTASRRLPSELGGFTLGALVQSNFGGALTIAGVPVHERLAVRFAPRRPLDRYLYRPPEGKEGEGADSGSGSCMMVVATDAPLSARQLQRLARRAVLGLGRVGSFVSHGSGDFVIAFSTRNRVPHSSTKTSSGRKVLRDERLDPLFLATVEAVEESIYNSLLRATTMSGRQGRRVEAIPIDELRALLNGR